ncbi:MAG TPA: fibronectin type III domain-containing protein [Bacteroidia bacterium]|nr:fibronectin type III domain-containing protein [Bacteroidia bacterium]
MPQLLRQPYLQMVADSAITIRWRTNVLCQTAVLYGNDPDSLNFTMTDSVNVIDHEIRLTGLSPDTRYYYAVSDGINILQGDSNNYFKTAPVKGMSKHVRIWSMGDTGINTIDQNNVRDAFLIIMTPCQLICCICWVITPIIQVQIRSIRMHFFKITMRIF